MPEPMREILGGMLDAPPEDRPTTFELAMRLEQDWDAIRTVWEKPTDKPYLVAFMPDESVDTIYNTRGWISRNPREPAGRAELHDFFARELRGAVLVHSPTGARGFVTGDNAALDDAEWVLVGDKGVWFCAYLREMTMGGPGRRLEEVMLIKFVRSKDEAAELSRAMPRRRVPDIEPVSFGRGQSTDHLRTGLLPWTPLVDSVKQRGNRDVGNESFLQSMKFLLEYQRAELAACAYPFVSEGGTNLAVVSWDRKRDTDRLLHWPMLNAYSQNVNRLPALGDFVGELDVTDDDEGSKTILLEIDCNDERPAFTDLKPLLVEFDQRLDEETIRVRLLRGGTMPRVGWLRPRSESGTRVQLARQQNALRQLAANPGLVRALYDPPDIDLNRHQWEVESGAELQGNAPTVISDILSHRGVLRPAGAAGLGQDTHRSARIAPVSAG